MIVEVFIAKRYAKYTLSEHSSLLVSDEKLVARVGDTAIDSFDQADSLVDLS